MSVAAVNLGRPPQRPLGTFLIESSPGFEPIAQFSGMVDYGGFAPPLPIVHQGIEFPVFFAHLQTSARFL
jgi:hypothetical protein